MKLTLFNGSPRRKASNSKILMDQFLEGYSTASGESYEVHYLTDIKKSMDHLKAFSRADYVIFIFPLYTDSMPGIVKHFFEMLYKQTHKPEKKVGFIVQSGFPKAKHSVYLEKYLRRFTARMGCHYLGTVIKGGVEGMQIKPPSWNRPLFKAFEELGKHFARKGEFDQNIVERLGKPHHLSFFHRSMFLFFGFFGLTNFYWNKKLKEHGAFSRRFDKPYYDRKTLFNQ